MSITDHKETHLVEDGKGNYTLTGSATLEQLSTLLRREYQEKLPGRALCSPGAAREFLEPMLSALTVEKFMAVWLDSKHHVLKVEILSSGTINKTSIYPREVVMRGLEAGAAAVMFAHNHPSGDTSPSDSDKKVTQTLTSALGLFDIRVLDHFIIGLEDTFSFAERGMI